jgi:hypothetical protein
LGFRYSFVSAAKTAAGIMLRIIPRTSRMLKKRVNLLAMVLPPVNMDCYFPDTMPSISYPIVPKEMDKI